MTSSNGSIFRVTGPLCGEFTGPGEFPTQRPVTRSFDVFFDLRLNKRLSKQPWGWWLQTQSWSLWRHCNVSEKKTMFIGHYIFHFISSWHLIQLEFKNGLLRTKIEHRNLLKHIWCASMVRLLCRFYFVLIYIWRSNILDASWLALWWYTSRRLEPEWRNLILADISLMLKAVTWKTNRLRYARYYVIYYWYTNDIGWCVWCTRASHPSS